MRGSIVKRGNGYSVVIDLGPDPITGRRRQKWHSGYATKKQAQAALAEMVSAVNKGTYVEKTRQTVAEFASDWLTAIAPTVRPATHYSYARNLRLHVLPYLGGATLAGVDAGALNRLYAQLLADGRRNQVGGGLSARSVAYVHTIAHRMFKDAVRWGRLARNPADAADPPKKSAAARTELRTWSADEVRAFLHSVSADRLAALFVLLATTGMRRGEALGLRWTDLDLDAARASVRQTVIVVNHVPQLGQPKTAKSARPIELDPATVAALREHRRQQAAERLQVGAGWADRGLVFCQPTGQPIHPERLSEAFVRRARAAQLPTIRLHDLRHTRATLALGAGVHPKVVQERLGHSTIAVTMDIYSHVLASLHSDAAGKVAGLIFGRVESVG